MSLHIQNAGSNQQIAFKSRGLSKLLSDPKQLEQLSSIINGVSPSVKNDAFIKGAASKSPMSVIRNILANLKNTFEIQ